MDQQLTGMITRSEHAQRQTSQTPVLDFDHRGAVYTPGWLEQSIHALSQAAGNAIISLKDRMRREPTVTARKPQIADNR